MVAVKKQQVTGFRIAARLGCGLLAIGFMSGCSRQFAEIEAVFAPPPAVQPTHVPVVYRGPIYCYDTIADPHCYAEPFPRAAERFIGADVTPGDFPGTDDNGRDGGNSIPAN